MTASLDFGRRRQHDEANRRFAYPIRAAKLYRKRHAMNAAHVDQFYLGGCVGFSGTNALNCSQSVRSRVVFNNKIRLGPSGRTYLGNDDGLRNYSESTRRDPFTGTWPPTDTGSSAIGLMKWWVELGVITGYDWTFTFDAFLAALLRQPVLIGSEWYQDMMFTGPDGVISTNLNGDGGGHEYLATEVIPAGVRAYGRLWSQTHIGCEQSWGEGDIGFGSAEEPGRFFLPADAAEELIIHRQGDVCVPRFL